MPTWPIAPARYDVNAPVSTDLLADIIAQIASNTGALSSTVNASNVPPVQNGSFEVDANLANPPTGWTYAALGGGSGSVTNTDSSHGANCYKAVHPGGALNGGCALTTTDYMPVSVGQAFELYFSTKASNANVRVKVDAYWYDRTQSQIGLAVNVFDQNGTFPTSWRTFSVGLVPATTPSEACFMRLVFTLGDPSLDPVSSTNIFLDNVALTFRRQGSRFQLFGSGAGNWTVPSGVTRIRAWVLGAGGGGVKVGSYWLSIGAGGGFAMGDFDVYPGQVIPYTVGACVLNLVGGDTTFLTMIGGGGSNGGSGGSSSGGNLNLVGRQPGHPMSGWGGDSALGWFGGLGRGNSSHNVGTGGLVGIWY